MGGAVGANIAGFLQEHVDISALKDAGFGATGFQLESYKRDAFKSLFSLSGGMRTKMLLALREMVKETMVSDPDMPGCIRRRMEHAIEQAWADIIIYEEKMVKDAENGLTGRAEKDHEGLANMGNRPLLFSPMWIRAKVLYCMFPFDKSIFGQIKDPLWWVLLVVSMVPQFGIRIIFWATVLLFILRGCPADEFQLVSYILAFKGTQVISSGLVMSVMAAVKYYLCVHPKEYHSCAADGPGVQDYIGSSGVDFVGSCILVWLAFFSLPFSKTSGGSRSMGQDDKLSNASESEDEGGCRCCGKLRKCTFCCRCCRWDPTRGGRLAPLLCWDIMTFVLSIALFISLVYVDITHLRPDGQPADVVDHPVHTWKDIGHIINEDLGTWNVRVAVFISRTFYAWLSFPFLVFKIPVITSILTHTSPTGYNRRGVCVPFMMRPMPKDA